MNKDDRARLKRRTRAINCLQSLCKDKAETVMAYIKEIEEENVYLADECTDIETFYDGFVDQFNVTNMRVIQ